MEKNKLKLLYVLDIIKETDELHPITATQICKKLKLYGIEAERKSICRDINTLIEYGYDINLMADNKLGYFFGERIFEDWELKVLIDAIWQSKFLTKSNSKIITDKLISLSSAQSQKMLKKITPVKSYIKTKNTSTKLNIDNILSAIRTDKKISFKYVYTDVKMEPVYKRNGLAYIVNPYSLIWKNDKYYLIGNYDKYDDLSYYRLDKIKELVILEEPIKKSTDIVGDNPDLKIEAYVSQSIYNYAGEKIRLHLQVGDYMVDDIIDYFGDEVTFTPNGNRYDVSVCVNESQGLYYWLLQFGENVKVISPNSVKEKLIAKLKNICKQYE